jgi:hypothetical protein
MDLTTFLCSCPDLKDHLLLHYLDVRSLICLHVNTHYAKSIFSFDWWRKTFGNLTNYGWCNKRQLYRLVLIDITYKQKTPLHRFGYTGMPGPRWKGDDRRHPYQELVERFQQETQKIIDIVANLTTAVAEQCIIT